MAAWKSSTNVFNYRKPVDRELCRRKVLNTQLYLPRMTAGNFEDKTALLNTKSLRNEIRIPRTYSRTSEETQIYLPDDHDGRNFEDKTKRTTEHNLFAE